MHLLPATCFRAVERDKFHLPSNSIGSLDGLVSGPRDENPGNTFSGALEKLRKAIISFVVSVSPSVCAHGTTRIPLDGF
jgi:hypothetical protein